MKLIRFSEYRNTDSDLNNASKRTKVLTHAGAVMRESLPADSDNTQNIANIDTYIALLTNTFETLISNQNQTAYDIEIAKRNFKLIESELNNKVSKEQAKKIISNVLAEKLGLSSKKKVKRFKKNMKFINELNNGSGGNKYFAFGIIGGFIGAYTFQYIQDRFDI